MLLVYNFLFAQHNSTNCRQKSYHNKTTCLHFCRRKNYNIILIIYLLLYMFIIDLLYSFYHSLYSVMCENSRYPRGKFSISIPVQYQSTQLKRDKLRWPWELCSSHSRCFLVACFICLFLVSSGIISQPSSSQQFDTTRHGHGQFYKSFSFIGMFYSDINLVCQCCYKTRWYVLGLAISESRFSV